MHVKFKKKMLKIFWIFPLIIIFAIALFTYIIMNFGNLTDFTGSNKATSETANLIASGVQVPQNDTTPGHRLNNSVANNTTFASQPQTIGDEKYNAQMLTPRYPEQPESKPIYDELRKPKSFEYPVAIIESKGHCKAYSEQGTLLDIPQNFCKKWLKEGRFNPYKEPPSKQPIQQQQQATDNQANSILALSDSTKHDEMRASIQLDAQ